MINRYGLIMPPGVEDEDENDEFESRVNSIIENAERQKQDLQAQRQAVARRPQARPQMTPEQWDEWAKPSEDQMPPQTNAEWVGQGLKAQGANLMSGFAGLFRQGGGVIRAGGQLLGAEPVEHLGKYLEETGEFGEQEWLAMRPKATIEDEQRRHQEYQEKYASDIDQNDPWYVNLAKGAMNITEYAIDNPSDALWATLSQSVQSAPGIMSMLVGGQALKGAMAARGLGAAATTTGVMHTVAQLAPFAVSEGVQSFADSVSAMHLALDKQTPQEIKIHHPELWEQYKHLGDEQKIKSRILAVESARAAGVTATWVGAVGLLLGGFGKGAGGMKRFILNANSEGLQELLQSPVEQAGMDWITTGRVAWENVPESMATGYGSGLLTHAAMSGRSIARPHQIDVDADEAGRLNVGRYLIGMVENSGGKWKIKRDGQGGYYIEIKDNQDAPQGIKIEFKQTSDYLGEVTRNPENFLTSVQANPGALAKLRAAGVDTTDATAVVDYVTKNPGIIGPWGMAQKPAGPSANFINDKGQSVPVQVVIALAADQPLALGMLGHEMIHAISKMAGLTDEQMGKLIEQSNMIKKLMEGAQNRTEEGMAYRVQAVLDDIEGHPVQNKIREFVQRLVNPISGGTTAKQLVGKIFGELYTNAQKAAATIGQNAQNAADQAAPQTDQQTQTEQTELLPEEATTQTQTEAAPAPAPAEPTTNEPPKPKVTQKQIDALEKEIQEDIKKSAIPMTQDELNNAKKIIKEKQALLKEYRTRFANDKRQELVDLENAISTAIDTHLRLLDEDTTIDNLNYHEHNQFHDAVRQTVESRLGKMSSIEKRENFRKTYIREINKKKSAALEARARSREPTAAPPPPAPAQQPQQQQQQQQQQQPGRDMKADLEDLNKFVSDQLDRNIDHNEGYRNVRSQLPHLRHVADHTIKQAFSDEKLRRQSREQERRDREAKAATNAPESTRAPEVATEAAPAAPEVTPEVTPEVATTEAPAPKLTTLKEVKALIDEELENVRATGMKVPMRTKLFDEILKKAGMSSEEFIEIEGPVYFNEAIKAKQKEEKDAKKAQTLIDRRKQRAEQRDAVVEEVRQRARQTAAEPAPAVQPSPAEPAPATEPTTPAEDPAPAEQAEPAEPVEPAEQAALDETDETEPAAEDDEAADEQKKMRAEERRKEAARQAAEKRAAKAEKEGDQEEARRIRESWADEFERKEQRRSAARQEASRLRDEILESGISGYVLDGKGIRAPEYEDKSFWKDGKHGTWRVPVNSAEAAWWRDLPKRYRAAGNEKSASTFDQFHSSAIRENFLDQDATIDDMVQRLIDADQSAKNIMNSWEAEFKSEEAQAEEFLAELMANIPQEEVDSLLTPPSDFVFAVKFKTEGEGEYTIDAKGNTSRKETGQKKNMFPVVFIDQETRDLATREDVRIILFDENRKGVSPTMGTDLRGKRLLVAIIDKATGKLIGRPHKVLTEPRVDLYPLEIGYNGKTITQLGNKIVSIDPGKHIPAGPGQVVERRVKKNEYEASIARINTQIESLTEKIAETKKEIKAEKNLVKKESLRKVLKAYEASLEEYKNALNPQEEAPAEDDDFFDFGSASMSGMSSGPIAKPSKPTGSKIKEDAESVKWRQYRQNRAEGEGNWKSRDLDSSRFSLKVASDNTAQAAAINMAKNIKRFGWDPKEYNMTSEQVDLLLSATPDTSYQNPVSFSGGKVVRYALKSGTGLLNRSAYDMDKLSEKDAIDLMDYLAVGLQQPLDISNNAEFYFTAEGEKRHRNLLRLLKKAAVGTVIRTEIETSDKPIWESADGQIAFDGRPTSRADTKSDDTKFGLEQRKPQDVAKEAEAKWPGVTVSLYEDQDGMGRLAWNLSSIVVPKGIRGQGTGTEVMKYLTNEADKAGAIITLTPSKDFGATSVERLRSFYGRLGFVRNTGKTVDYALNGTMYRKPVPIRKSDDTKFALKVPVNPAYNPYASNAKSLKQRVAESATRTTKNILRGVRALTQNYKTRIRNFDHRLYKDLGDAETTQVRLMQTAMEDFPQAFKRAFLDSLRIGIDTGSFKAAVDSFKTSIAERRQALAVMTAALNQGDTQTAIAVGKAYWGDQMEKFLTNAGNKMQFIKDQEAERGIEDTTKGFPIAVRDLNGLLDYWKKTGLDVSLVEEARQIIKDRWGKRTTPSRSEVADVIAKIVRGNKELLSDKVKEILDNRVILPEEMKYMHNFYDSYSIWLEERTNKILKRDVLYGSKNSELLHKNLGEIKTHRQEIAKLEKDTSNNPGNKAANDAKIAVLENKIANIDTALEDAGMAVLLARIEAERQSKGLPQFTPEQASELAELYRGYMRNPNQNQFASEVSRTATAMFLTQAWSTIKQISDMPRIAARSPKAFAKAVVDLAKYNAAVMGLTSKSASFNALHGAFNKLFEMVDVYKPSNEMTVDNSPMSIFGSYAMRAIGFPIVDTDMKKLFVMSTWRKMQDLAVKWKNGDKAAARSFMIMMNEISDTTEARKNALKLANKVLSDMGTNTISSEVITQLRSIFADFQPLTRGSMTALQAQGGLWKLPYQFKSWTISSQNDWYRRGVNNTMDAIKGLRAAKTQEEKAFYRQLIRQGITTLVVEPTAAVMFASLLNVLRAMSMDKGPETPEEWPEHLREEMWGEFFTLCGVNKYSLEAISSKDGDIARGVAGLTIPITGLVQDGIYDINRIIEEAGKGKVIPFDELRNTKVLPIFGSYYYNRYGYGHKRRVAREERELARSTSSRRSKPLWTVDDINKDLKKIFDMQDFKNELRKRLKQ